MRRRWTCFAILAAVTGSLSACGDSTNPADALPDGAVGAIGLTTRDDLEATLDALTVASLIRPLATSPTGQAACVTPSSSLDSDGDGVPDDATYTFTAPPCRFSGIRGSTLDVVGQLRVVDPVPDVAGFGYQATLTGLRFTLVPDDEDDPAYTVTRNGTRVLSGSTAGLRVVTDLQVIRTFVGFSDAAVDQQWTVDFTADTPIQINQPLPSGTLDVSGTLGWTRGDENFALTVTTPTPLHYNAGCADGPQRFDAGELRAAGTFDETAGYIRIVWSECGREPSVGFVREGD